MPATKNGSTHSRKNRLTPICAAIAGAVMSFANVAEADDSVSFSSNYWIGTFITGDDSANTSSDWMYPLNWQFGNLYAAPLPGWNTYIGPSKVIVNGIPSGYQFHATEAVLAAPFSASIFGMGAWDGQSQLRLRDGALLDATAYIGTTALLDDPLYNLAGPYIATGPIKPATIIFDGGSTAGSWNFYANSRVEVNKAYAQAQGTWSGTLGELVVAKNASFVIGNNGLTINKISNSGNIDLGGSNLSVSGTLDSSGTINLGGAALILTGNTTLAGSGQTVLNGGYIDSAYGTNQTLTIASGHTLRGYGNLGGGYYGSNTQVINQGSIVADQTSPLYFSGASLDNTNGLIEIKDGSQFNVGSGTVNGGVIKGQGSATLSGGTYKDLGLSGQLQVQSGLVYISGSIANQGTLNVNGSVLILTGNTTLAGSGQTVLNGGYIDSAYGTGQTLTIASGHTLRGYGNLGGGYYGSNTQVNNQGRIVADTGSTLYVSGSALNNQGGIVVTKDSVMNIAGGTSFVQDGAQAKTVVHGTLSVNELTLAAGQLSGNGKIIGNVVNTGGQVNPGASPGKLSIEGNYTQGADGDLVIEINGTEQGVTYDWLSVAGDVSLAGDLYLQIGAGLTDGLSFDILSYTGQLTGAFDHIYANGWNVHTTYGAQGLSVTLTTAVPEPESYALALAGLLLAFTAARRRQKAA